MADSYTHLQVEAALCVWEYLNDVTLLDPSRVKQEWVDLREGVGSVALRHASIEIGKWVLQVYDACVERDQLVFDMLTYDWEVVPMIVDLCRDGEGAPLCYAPFPDVEKTVEHVFALMVEKEPA